MLQTSQKKGKTHCKSLRHMHEYEKNSMTILYIIYEDTNGTDILDTSIWYVYKHTYKAHLQDTSIYHMYMTHVLNNSVQGQSMNLICIRQIMYIYKTYNMAHPQDIYKIHLYCTSMWQLIRHNKDTFPYKCPKNLSLLDKSIFTTHLCDTSLRKIYKTYIIL